MGKVEAFLSSQKMQDLLKRVSEVARTKKEASVGKQRALKNMRHALKSFIEERKRP